jgi:hypothetical protein
MGYGEKERQYAEPFANALVNDSAFCIWVLKQTEFAELADNARLLHREMKLHRSAIAQNWWRSHFSETCRCLGCSGKETDILAIFESDTGLRVALHIEVKHPGDTFKKDGLQAAGYPKRAACWADQAPSNVLPHHQASTMLLFSAQNARKYETHLAHFKTLITFESIENTFPSFWLESRGL